MFSIDYNKPKIFRIVIIFSLFILICVELYIFLVGFYTVNVVSFDVEVVGVKADINESKKTFNLKNENNDFMQESKEYNEVLAVSKSYAAVIDTDNKFKLVDLYDNIIVVFKDYIINTNNILTTKIHEEHNTIKINIIYKDKTNVDYCYNNYTKDTYAIIK